MNLMVKLLKLLVSGTALSANEFKINGTLVGEFDTGRLFSATAINVGTSEHGVTAKAHNEVTIALNEAAIPNAGSEFFINDSK